MVVKVYVSGISGNHEIRKQQQRVQFILSSLKLEYEEIDITEIGKETERDFMREQCKLHNRPNALPPQIFNDSQYCGNFDDFEIATEDDTLMEFLKLDNFTSTAEVMLDTSNNCKASSGNNVESEEKEAIEA